MSEEPLRVCTGAGTGGDVRTGAGTVYVSGTVSVCIRDRIWVGGVYRSGDRGRRLSLLRPSALETLGVWGLGFPWVAGLLVNRGWGFPGFEGFGTWEDFEGCRMCRVQGPYLRV